MYIQPIYFKMFKELHGINNLNMHLLEGHFQFTPPPVFFPIFGLRVSEIGNRYPGFSGMLIPNMTSVLQYEACLRRFYQDGVNFNKNYFLSFLVI